MSTATPNVAASIRARLLNIAKAQGVDFNQVLVRFALERILYRLTQSIHMQTRWVRLITARAKST